MTFESDRAMVVAEARKHIDDELNREIEALRADLEALAVAAQGVAEMCEAIGWRCHGYRLAGLQEALARPGVEGVKDG